MATALEHPALTTVRDALVANAATLNGDNGAPMTPDPEDLDTVPPEPDPPQEAVNILENDSDGSKSAAELEEEALAETAPETQWDDVMVDELDEAGVDDDSGYGRSDDGADTAAPLDFEEREELREKRQDDLEAWVSKVNDNNKKAELKELVNEGVELDPSQRLDYMELFDSSPPTKVDVESLDDISEGEMSPVDEDDAYSSPPISREVSPPGTPGIETPDLMTERDLRILDTPAGQGVMETLVSGQATPQAFEGKPPESFYATIVANLDTLASDEFKEYTDQLSAAVEERESTQNERDIVKALKAASDIARGEAANLHEEDWEGPESAVEKGAWAVLIQSGIDPHAHGKDWREAVDQTSAVAERDPSVSERLARFVEQQQASST